MLSEQKSRVEMKLEDWRQKWAERDRLGRVSAVSEQERRGFEIPREDVVLDKRAKALGVGGSAIVWSARVEGRAAAAKVALPEPEAELDVENEAEQLMSLRNPALFIRLLGVSRVPDDEVNPLNPRLMLVLDRMWMDLRCLLKSSRGRVMSLKDRVRILERISLGVEFLHNHDRIHCDLKAGNVLVDSDGEPYLSDFGYAHARLVSQSRRSSSKSVDGYWAGTTPWMAPEVLQEHPCTRRSDVFSFGVLCWEVLTCEEPWEKVPVEAIRTGVIRGDRLDVSVISNSDLRDVIGRCWLLDDKLRPSMSWIAIFLTDLRRRLDH